jgi:hypothetical protein
VLVVISACGPPARYRARERIVERLRDAGVFRCPAIERPRGD